MLRSVMKLDYFDETDEEFVLWHEINLDNRGHMLELPYAVSVWINGTV